MARIQVTALADCEHLSRSTRLHARAVRANCRQFCDPRAPRPCDTLHAANAVIRWQLNPRLGFAMLCSLRWLTRCLIPHASRGSPIVINPIVVLIHGAITSCICAPGQYLCCLLFHPDVMLRVVQRLVRYIVCCPYICVRGCLRLPAERRHWQERRRERHARPSPARLVKAGSVESMRRRLGAFHLQQGMRRQAARRHARRESSAFSMGTVSEPSRPSEPRRRKSCVARRMGAAWRGQAQELGAERAASGDRASPQRPPPSSPSHASASSSHR